MIVNIFEEKFKKTVFAFNEFLQKIGKKKTDFSTFFHKKNVKLFIIINYRSENSLALYESGMANAVQIRRKISRMMQFSTRTTERKVS